jgi:hypothetical protein
MLAAMLPGRPSASGTRALLNTSRRPVFLAIFFACFFPDFFAITMSSGPAPR